MKDVSGGRAEWRPHDSSSLICLCIDYASQVTPKVKNSHAIWEICVRSLGRENPLEKGMATHSSILAWKIPWTEEPGGLVRGSQRVGCD